MKSQNKNLWLDRLKAWWFFIPIIGFVIIFSSKVYALWQTPEKLDKTQESVQELAAQLQTYTASETEANKQRDKLISLMAATLMEGRT